jgi:hypothetical protein
MSRDRLKSGYYELNARLYATDAFFERIFGLQLRSAKYRQRREAARMRRRQNRLARVKAAPLALAVVCRLAVALARRRELTRHGWAYASAWLTGNAPLRRDRLRILEFLALCARHWHCCRVTAEARSNWGK